MTANAATGEHPLYVSESRSHTTSTAMEVGGVKKPNRPTAIVSGDGYIPGYKGHKPKTYDSIGASIYGAKDEGEKVVAPSEFQFWTIDGIVKYNDRYNVAEATRNLKPR